MRPLYVCRRTSFSLYLITFQTIAIEIFFGHTCQAQGKVMYDDVYNYKIELKIEIIELKQSLSTSTPFGICIWGESIRGPSHPEAQVVRHLISSASVTEYKSDAL